jgi:hypothetical protein
VWVASRARTSTRFQPCAIVFCARQHTEKMLLKTVCARLRLASCNPTPRNVEIL